MTLFDNSKANSSTVDNGAIPKIHLEQCYDLIKQKFDEANNKFIAGENEWNNKEEELASIIEKANLLMDQKDNEFEYISTKLEGKIQKLNLEKESLTERIKNLINTLIGLKDYALSVERSITIANEQNIFNRNYFSNSGIRDDFNTNDYSKTLISGMKEMIRKIDYKLMNEN